MEAIQYRGYSIQEDFRNPYSSKPEFMFYRTSEGIQHDADCDQDGFFYTGNCKWTDSIEDAKATIDDLIQEAIEEAQVVKEMYNQAHNIES
jgi:hypothetical protein